MDEEEASRFFGSRRTMRLHRSSASKTLRQDSARLCIYCHHPIEWYERYDTKAWVPLLLQEFPSRLLPERYRWSVFNGLVYLGDGGSERCRIVHPAVCPALDHDDERALRGLRRHYAVKTRKWIDEGAFVPPPRKDVSEEDVAEQLLQTGPGPRHVITYTYWTWLGPAELDQIRCVAYSSSTGERCQKMVLDDDLYEGQWTQRDIPVPPGRAGQETLWGGQKMWVCDLNALYPDGYKRWRDQRCTVHHGGNTPNVIPPQWVLFDTFRHSDFIAYERPKIARERKREGHPLLGQMRPVAMGSRCALCTNRSHVKEGDGWLCWECAPIVRRRSRIHEKWQSSPPKEEGTPEEPSGGEPPF
ncbi:DUF6083 domain-containing protein [Streptomyces sp. NPDC000229]|uniref:DUF6083 domain-containing protein n=1 Tax=Streptomyces sp. NPDC000229 TaxID=3154247 RepID=UPI00332E5A32